MLGEVVRWSKVTQQARTAKTMSLSGAELQIWDVDGKVYSTVETPKRGRPRKS